jgi:hypothetical protein
MRHLTYELNRWAEGGAWGDLVQEAERTVVRELAQVVVYAQVATVRADCARMTSEAQAIKAECEKRLPALTAEAAKRKAAADRQHDRCVAGRWEKAEDDLKLTELGREFGMVNGERAEVQRELDRTNRLLAELSKAAVNLAAVRAPETPLLASLKLV